MNTPKERAAKWWADKLNIPQKREAFRLALLEVLPDGDFDTYNDYDPRGLLLDAVRKAGIECRGYMFSGDDLGFPRKTGLRCTHGVLTAKEGYGADYIEVKP